MKLSRRITTWMTAVIVCLGMIVPVSTPVSAQGISTDQVTFVQLGRTDTTLTGPIDVSTFSFGLPADWKLNGAGSLDLFLNVTFDVAGSVTGDGQTTSTQSGGVLTVNFNDVTLGTILLDRIGDIQTTLAIPVEALDSTRLDGRMAVTFTLDTGLSCLIDRQTTIIIRSASSFNLPHASVTPDINLVNFPRPIYQASIYPDVALIVLPNEPTASELQGALTISSGLGNMTGSRLSLDLVRVGDLTEDQKKASHLIFLGKAGSLPILSDLKLPLTVAKTGAVESLFLTSEDDGVVQMINSPWNPAMVALVISGNSDAGVIKAAQAVSSGVLRTAGATNISLITDVSPVPLATTLPTDQTLVDLGYDGSLLTRRGINTVSYRFYIPPGNSVAGDSYFELAFSHSALLDFTRSGALISLNGRPLGSIKLTEQTASQSVNLARFTIPASAVVPGNNVLDVSFSLFPIVNCSVAGFQGLWARIWPDSRFHLPIGILPADITPVLGLDTYPAPYTFDSTLGSTAFVLPRGDIDSWKLALQVAGFLGDRAGGTITTLSAFYGDEITDQQKAAYHLLLFGRPSQQPLISVLRDVLPAPFPTDSDIADERNMQVSFRVQPDAPIGYLESLPSPWNADRIILAVLGNSAQGLRWSTDALILPDLRSHLAGDFAVINGTQIVTSDSRLLPKGVDPSSSGLNTPAASLTELANIPPVTAPKATQPKWVLPMMFISILLAVLVVTSVIYSGWKRNRVRGGKSIKNEKPS